jgi:hypothetical protein
MNAQEAWIISRWKKDHTNELRCTCEDCEREYELALKFMLKLGCEAQKKMQKRKARKSKKAGRARTLDPFQQIRQIFDYSALSDTGAVHAVKRAAEKGR